MAENKTDLLEDFLKEIRDLPTLKLKIVVEAHLEAWLDTITKHKNEGDIQRIALINTLEDGMKELLEKITK